MADPVGALAKSGFGVVSGLIAKLSGGTVVADSAIETSGFSLVGRAATGAGATAAITLAAQSILARAAGNVASLAVAANALLARAGSGDLASLALSADSVLGRDGSDNLSGALPYGRHARAPTIPHTATAVNAALSHVGSVLRFTLASPGTYTVMAQASVAWIDATVIHIELTATSQPLTITPDTGITIASIDGDGLVLYAGQCATLRRLSSDTWALTTARRIKGLTVGPAGAVPGAGPIRYVATGIAGVTTELTSRSLQGNAALADAATFTAAVEIPSTNNTVTRVRWFWYVGVAGTPSYAGGYFDVVYLRESSASDLHVLAAGYSSGSSAPLGWTIAASTDTGSGGQFRLLMTNGTGAARKAYARPQLSTEVLS